MFPDPSMQNLQEAHLHLANSYIIPDEETLNVDNRVVHVPVSLLLDAELLPSAILVWAALRLEPKAGPTQLERLTGLARHTVLRGIARAATISPPAGGPRVKLPAALLAERSVGARAKLLYGLLQTMPGRREFTYPSLSERLHLSDNTVKLAIRDLDSAGWISLTQKNRLKPIRFRLGTPELRRAEAEAALAQRRLQRAKFAGEAIMHEYLSLLIDSDQCTDNAKHGFLVNPLTGEWLELDRYYPAGFAFEFHGAQHDHATERYSQKEVEAQRLRDLIKAGLCVYQGIHLEIVRARDLSLQRLARKIDPRLPRRDLKGHEQLIDLLEEASLKYCANTPP